MKLKATIFAAVLGLLMSPSLWAVTHGFDVLEVGNPVQYYLMCDYTHDSDDWQDMTKLWYKCATFTHPVPSCPGSGAWPANDPLGVPGALHQWFHDWSVLAGTQNCRAVSWKNWYSCVLLDVDGDGAIDVVDTVDQQWDSHLSDGECPDPG